MARRRRALLLSAGVIVVAACGGGDDDTSNPLDAPSDDSGAAADDGPPAGDDAGEGDGAASELGAVTLDAEPLSAWIEVDGQRYEYLASGTIAFECSITSDNVRVNIQTPSEFFTLNGIVNQGDWLFTLNVAPPGDSAAVYGGSPLTTTGTVGLDATSMSYSGELDKVIGVDIANAEAVPAEFAINCEAPGPDPSAEIGDASFAAPFNSASSIRCDVSADAVDISVQQQVTARVQIAIDATTDGTTWLGSASVFADEGNYSSTIPADGTGLVIDGDTVTYDGMFTTPTGDAQGTVVVTCP